jgi:Spirocyclase AveC-like
MASTHVAPRPVAAAPTKPEVLPARRFQVQPAVWWALFGAAMVAVQVYVYVSWISSNDFRSIQTGIDTVPASVKTWAVISQATVTLMALGCVVWVVRQSLRARRLTFDAMLLIGWVSCFWLDPVPNLLRPQVFFNSYYVNMGSWVEHIPGWIGPTGANLPNSLLLECPAFFANILGSVFGCFVMRRAQNRWNLGKFATYLTGVAASMVVFLVMEEYMIQTGWLAWPGTIHALSIQGGTVHQMPLTEVVFCGFFLGGAMAALRFFRDDQGRSVAERGVDKLRVGRRAKTAVALLAVVGFCNAGWLTYNTVTVPLALFSDTMPKGFPSYMTNGMCGTRVIKLCPDAHAPIYQASSPGVPAVPGVNPTVAPPR